MTKKNKKIAIVFAVLIIVIIGFYISVNKENDLDKNINGDTQVNVSDKKNESYDEEEKEHFDDDEIKIETIESIEELYAFKNTSFEKILIVEAIVESLKIEDVSINNVEVIEERFSGSKHLMEDMNNRRISIDYIVSPESEIYQNGEIDVLPFYKKAVKLFSLISDMENLFMNLKIDENTYVLSYSKQMIVDDFGNNFKNDFKNADELIAYIELVNQITLSNRYKLLKEENMFKIYSLHDWGYPIETRGIYILEDEDWEKQIIRIVDMEYDILIDTMKIDQNVVEIDLDESMGWRMDIGSTGSHIITTEFQESLFSIHGIDTLNISVGGDSDFSANHFTYSEPITKAK